MTDDEAKELLEKFDCRRPIDPAIITMETLPLVAWMEAPERTSLDLVEGWAVLYQRIGQPGVYSAIGGMSNHVSHEIVTALQQARRQAG